MGLGGLRGAGPVGVLLMIESLLSSFQSLHEKIEALDYGVEDSAGVGFEVWVSGFRCWAVVGLTAPNLNRARNFCTTYPKDANRIPKSKSQQCIP